VQAFNQKIKPFRDSLVHKNLPWIIYSKSALSKELEFAKQFNLRQNITPAPPVQKERAYLSSIMETPFILGGFIAHLLLMAFSEILGHFIPLDREFYSSIWLSISILLAVVYAIVLFVLFGFSSGLLLNLLIPFCLLSFYRNTSENFWLSFLKKNI